MPLDPRPVDQPTSEPGTDPADPRDDLLTDPQTAPEAPSAASAVEVPPESTKVPRDVWVMVVAGFLIAVGFGLIAPVLPAFAKSFGMSTFAATVVVSAFAFFRVVCAPGGSRLVTRLGERSVYITGILIVAVSTGACAFATSYWQLLTFRALGGIGSTMFSISATALIIRLSPAHMRGRVSSLYAGGFLMGNILGPLVGGLLGGLGYRIPFVVYAITLVLSAVFIHLVMSRPDRTVRSAHSDLPVMTLAEAWRDSAFRSALAGGFANGWANFGIRVALIPLFVDAALHAGPGAAGFSLTLFAVGNGTALLFAGGLADKIGRKPPVMAGLTIAGLALIGIGLAPDVWVLYALSLVGGFGSGIMNPGAQAVMADVVGKERKGGPVIATMQMVTDAGTIAGPMVAGLIVDHGTYPVAFGVAGALVLLAAALWLPARETLPRKAAA